MAPRNRLALRVLSEDSLDRIEGTAYRLLDEIGISLQHAGATEMLHGLGCRVENGRVFIPRDCVQRALSQVTAQRVFYERDGVEAFRLGDGQVRFHSGGGLPFIRDLDSGQRRRPTLTDVEEATRLLDALPNVDVIIPLYGAQDVRARTAHRGLDRRDAAQYPQACLGGSSGQARGCVLRRRDGRCLLRRHGCFP